MKKNGFTLVELLAVIVILALLLTIAVPNVISISQRIRKNMYCSKIENIESAAKIYGQDYIDDISSTERIRVSKLIDNNIYKKEDKNCVLGNSNKPCVKDPRNNSMMDNDLITITIKDKRVYAEYDSSKKSVCNE